MKSKKRLEVKDIEGISPLLEEAVVNARDDRAKTAGLLADVVIYLKGSTDRFKDVGQVAAKYVETLQRSNEQLVKVATLLYKKHTSIDLSEEDKNKIFDELQHTGEDDD
tara:strand:- start:25923 stop:26249 length:327 start_codon:yes stop_codon:yes gene_type:complete